VGYGDSIYKNISHLAVIMDGNGRWAQLQNKNRFKGHKKGVAATRGVIEFCLRNKIKILTVYAFSSENWKRPKTEIDMLMMLFLDSLKKYSVKLMQENVKVRFIGNIEIFKNPLKRKMQEIICNTTKNDKLILNIAINYGGQQEVVTACNKILKENKHKEIDHATFATYLDLANIPAPDLLIRSGGYRRLSNFLLYHLAYTELYFTDVLWPDVDDKILNDACKFYQLSCRNFGSIDAH
jgi:undecaprenyl diphosphate synthase